MIDIEACELTLSPSFVESNLLLLELPAELEQAMRTSDSQEGLELMIKGFNSTDKAKQTATLCTKDQTFVMKKAESSNTQLLIPAANFKDGKAKETVDEPQDTAVVVVEGQVTFHYELQLVKGDVVQLARLMQTRAIGEATDQDEEWFLARVVDQKLGFYMGELERRMQASWTEIEEELRRIGCFKVRGLWCCLSEQLERDIMGEVITSVKLLSLDPTRVPLDKLKEEMATMDGYCWFAVDQVLRKNATTYTNDYIALDKARVGQHIANKMFSQHQLHWKKPEFMETWAAELPSGIEPNLSYLRGLVIDRGDMLQYFNVQDVLMLSDRECFKRLFQISAQWKLSQMEPYIEHLLSNTVKKADLLRKFTRSSKGEGEERLLSAR